jgi:SHS2 domain-containing protein
MKRYEFIDHTADVIVKAYGDRLEEAFANAALGMFDIITGGAEIKPRYQIRFEVRSIDMEGLLVNFLSELIVKHEVDNIVLAQIDVIFTGEYSLKAVARCEKFDRSRHGEGIQVKGVSYHMMEIEEGSGSETCHVQVLFDI